MCSLDTKYLLYSIKYCNQEGQKEWNRYQAAIRISRRAQKSSVQQQQGLINHDVFDCFEADSLHLHHSERLRKGTHDVAVAAGDSNSKHVVVVLDYGKNSNNESYRGYGGPTHSEDENDCYDAFQTSQRNDVDLNGVAIEVGYRHMDHVDCNDQTCHYCNIDPALALIDDYSRVAAAAAAAAVVVVVAVIVAGGVVAKESS